MSEHVIWRCTARRNRTYLPSLGTYLLYNIVCTTHGHSASASGLWNVHRGEGASEQGVNAFGEGQRNNEMGYNTTSKITGERIHPLGQCSSGSSSSLTTLANIK
jgi:hypothetical protein